MMRLTCFLALFAFTASAALAQPTINGTSVGDEAFYGSALSTQNTRTHYGDGPLGGNPDPIIAGDNLGGPNGGSEIDQVFATVSDGRLYVLVAGNLEGNFNKMNVFIDGGGSGVNSLDGDNLPAGLDGFCCGGVGTTDGALQRMDGLTFDAGFNAGYGLVFTHGGETVNSGLADEAQFWAISSHFADLTSGSSGAVGGLGMQLAQRGEPRVLRAMGGPSDGDYNDDGTVDAADYTVWRDNDGTTTVLPNDPTGGTIGAAQYNTWRANFGATESADGALGDFAHKPSGNPGNSDDLISDFTLAGLGQGELIDRDYVMTHGGCSDDTGAGCLAKEFEFALNVDPSEIGSNESSHREFDNFVDLRMAINNSNVEGVEGSGGPDFSFDNGAGDTDDPENVVTGIEFSIPLSEIGNPAGDIKIAAFVSNGAFEHLSNQFAGDGIQTDIDDPLGVLSKATGAQNLGNSLFNDGPDPPLFTLADIVGDQFVTVSQPGLALTPGVVPEPSTSILVTLILGALAGGRVNRR